jgi:hypothetical protein
VPAPQGGHVWGQREREEESGGQQSQRMGRSAATAGTHRTAGSAKLNTKGTLGYIVYIQGMCIGMQSSATPLNASKVLPYNLELVIGYPHRVYVTKISSLWYKCCVGSSRSPSGCCDMLSYRRATLGDRPVSDILR